MNSNVKFKEDLKQGNIGERLVAKYLESKGFTIINYGNTSDYDILTLYKGKEVKFEIKTDLYEYYKKIITNNLFIEVICNNKFSGINSSKADYFIYLLPNIDEMYMIKISDLKELLMSRGFRRSSQSGDGGRVIGYLIDRDEAKEWFKVIKFNNIIKYFTKRDE